MKYKQEETGEWIYPKRKGYRMMCCDCGLVHVFDFRLAKDKRGNFIQFRVFRHERATASARRKLKKII